MQERAEAPPELKLLAQYGFTIVDCLTPDLAIAPG
jgi:hypothetical protein